MKKYKNILFDLFDTLILFKPELLPEVRFKDKTYHSTGIEVYETFKSCVGNYEFDEFYANFMESYKKFQFLKNIDNREYPNSKRFEIMFELMGLNIQDKNLLDKFVDAHMHALENSMVFPEEHREVLEYLKEKSYNLSILSNFDYAPTVNKLLDKYTITHYFKRIFISDEIGWRKPSKKIFDYAISNLKLSVSDTIYVGDDYERDIIGSNVAGLDSIWINNGHLESDPAKYSVNNLKQITGIL